MNNKAPAVCAVYLAILLTSGCMLSSMEAGRIPTTEMAAAMAEFELPELTKTMLEQVRNEFKGDLIDQIGMENEELDGIVKRVIRAPDDDDASKYDPECEKTFGYVKTTIKNGLAVENISKEKARETSIEIARMNEAARDVIEAGYLCERYFGQPIEEDDDEDSESLLDESDDDMYDSDDTNED